MKKEESTSILMVLSFVIGSLIGGSIVIVFQQSSYDQELNDCKIKLERERGYNYLYSRTAEDLRQMYQQCNENCK